VAAGWYGNDWMNGQKEASLLRQVESLLASGRIAVEKRRWPEAAGFYNEVLALSPDSKRARDGLGSIEEGKLEEQRQQVAWLLGTARTAIDGRDWPGVEEVCAEVRKLDPDNAQVPELLQAVRDGRVFDQVLDLLDKAEDAIREEQWEALARHARDLGDIAPNHVDLPRVKEMATEGLRLMEERRTRGRELYLAALELDHGAYSSEAVELLREAMRLESRPEYEALYKKISSHARVLRVPEDYPTIAEALATARDKDKVMVGEGVYKETLVLKAAVELEGAGPEKTVVECPAETGSVVTAGKDAKGARIAGMLMRQTGMLLAEQRFPVVAIDGSEVLVEDCWVENGSGHGIGVLNGSAAVLRNVRVMRCGWDGLAVAAGNSRATVTDSRFEENIHHGIDAWDSGAVDVKRTRCRGNGLTGIVLMSSGMKSTIEGSTSDANRELGIQVANGAVVELNGNQFLSNLLGGMLVRDPGTQVSSSGNRIMNNGTVGVVIDRQSDLVRWEQNVSTGNDGEQVRMKVDLATLR
jgi:tetratricopeptide (TPR) repeat protein